MKQTNYISGRSREYRLKRHLEGMGFTVLRTAGSHGFVDLIALDKQTRIINFIQVKPSKMGKKASRTLQVDSSWSNGAWTGKFMVLTSPSDINAQINKQEVH